MRPTRRTPPRRSLRPRPVRRRGAGVDLALLELLDEGLIITGDEIILDANSAACRLLDRDYWQIAGRPLAELFPSGEAFPAARARLFIHGERRGALEFAAAPPRQDDRWISSARRGCARASTPSCSARRRPPGQRTRRAATSCRRRGSTRTAVRRACQRPRRRHAPYFRTLEGTTPGFGGEYLEHGLRSALTGGGLALHFQPLVDARSGRICAGEALLRWKHPELGPAPLPQLHRCGQRPPS